MAAAELKLSYWNARKVASVFGDHVGSTIFWLASLISCGSAKS